MNSTKNLAAALALSAAQTVACSDSNQGTSTIGTGPAYLVGTRVFNDTLTTSYFHVVSSLEETSEIDPSRALEVSGAAKLYAVPDVGWFAVGAGEDPTITRYALTDDGRLQPREKISLRPYGVQSLWDTLYVVSPTKMYYPDRAGNQLVVINPSTMKLEGTVPLPQTARDGYLSLYGYTPLLRAGQLLFSVGWFDWESTDSVLGETGLVVLDTKNDQVERFDVDARCGGITTGVVTESGDAYFVSSALAGAAHQLGRLTTQPCALRVNAGSSGFDADFAPKLAELTAGRVAGEPVPAGGSAMFLRVLDEELATVTNQDATWDITGQPAWRWWRWDVTQPEAVLVASLAPSTSDVFWFQVDGRVYGTETSDNYSQTTVIELTAPGGPQPRLRAPGFIHGVARIR
ncbi:MAG: hypothetical protein ACOY0T_30845 [Myxococcota bacterium]